MLPRTSQGYSTGSIWYCSKCSKTKNNTVDGKPTTGGTGNDGHGSDNDTVEPKEETLRLEQGNHLM